MKWPDLLVDEQPNMTPAAPASAEPMKNVDGDHAVDVDAHHRRRLAVERRRPHRLAELRARDEAASARTISDDRADDDDDAARAQTCTPAGSVKPCSERRRSSSNVS